MIQLRNLFVTGSMLAVSCSAVAAQEAAVISVESSAAIAGENAVLERDVVDVVSLDRASLVRIPEAFASIIIGNPGIVTLSLSETGAGVLTGKAYGETNIIFLNKAGDVLQERIVRVSPQPNVVSISTPDGRQSFACNPRCEAVPVIGDKEDSFGRIYNQFQQAGGFANNPTGGVSGSGRLKTPAGQQDAGIDGSDRKEIEEAGSFGEGASSEASGSGGIPSAERLFGE